MFQFSYRLRSIDWAEIMVGNGESQEVFSASYIADHPIDLMLDVALRQVWKHPEFGLGTEIEFCIPFYGEPEGHFLSLDVNGDNVQFALTFLEDSMICDEASSKEVEILRGETTPVEFARAIHDAVDCLLDKMTPAQYEEKWHSESEIPLHRFSRLRRCLGLPPKAIVLD